MPIITIEYEDGKIVSENCTDFIIHAKTENMESWIAVHGDTITQLGLLKALELDLQDMYPKEMCEK